MNKEVRNYRRTKMQKEHIVETLREKGCRITKQRLMLIDIILEEECQSCKEIYYKAVKADAKIGTATVYRMVNTLEEIGAITRNSVLINSAWRSGSPPLAVIPPLPFP